MIAIVISNERGLQIAVNSFGMIGISVILGGGDMPDTNPKTFLKITGSELPGVVRDNILGRTSPRKK